MKTRYLRYLTVFLSVLVLSSCKKKNPDEDKSHTPVFTFDANINGSVVSLQAGNNNYYMYTSYTQDANNVYNFTGDLKPYGCSTGCGNSLQIIVNDYQSLAVGAPANIGTSLVPGYYALQVPGGASTQYSFNFTSFSYNVAPQSLAWDFGDGTTSTTQNPVHIYTHPGNYTICLTTTFSDLTTGSICNPLLVGTPESGCTGNFTYTATVNSLSFSGSPNGTPGYSYLWDFGDGATSTSPTPTHNYAAAGKYLVSMKVTDSQNKVLIYNRNCFTQGYSGSINGFYFLPNAAISNTSGLSNVTINWTDASGLVWTSNNAAQPAGSYFKILSVDPYNTNSSGQTTKKVHAQLKCTLYNGSNSILLDNGDVTFGVAYH